MMAPTARDKQHWEQKWVNEIGCFCCLNFTANVSGSIAEGSGFGFRNGLDGLL